MRAPGHKENTLTWIKLEMSRAGMGIEEIGAAMPGLRRKTIAELHAILHELRNKAGDWTVVRGCTVDTHGEKPFSNRRVRQ
jgi:hypothetical protein